MFGTINVKIPDTVIGLGAISTIGDIAKGFKPSKILIVTDGGIVKAGIIDAVRQPLEKAGLAFDVFAGCEVEPPIDLVEKLARKVKRGGYDLLIGVGGGSCMDTTKVVSILALTGMTMGDYIGGGFHHKVEGKIIPKILVPTTAGTGAEWSAVTPVYNHEDGTVHTVFAWDNLANKVIIDPELTFKLPQRVTADTGMDALTHAIEAYTSATANVFSDMLASTAIKIIAENLRQAYGKGQQSVEARYNMAIAAAFAMNAAISSGIGLSHFMSEVLGPKAHISHGTAVTMSLPYVMEYNLVANPSKYAKVAELMGENVSGLSTLDAAAKSVVAVRRLIQDLDFPQRMRDVGIRKRDIPTMAKHCYGSHRQIIAAFNPRDANEKDIAQIFQASW